MFDPEKPDEHQNDCLGPNKESFIDNDAFEHLKKNFDWICGKLRIHIFVKRKTGANWSRSVIFIKRCWE